MFNGLATERYDRQYSDRQLIDRIARYFIPQKALMGRLSVIVLIVTALCLAEPLLMSQGVQWATKQVSLPIVMLLALILLAAEVLTWMFNRLRRRAAGRLIAEIVGRLRTDAFAATISHDMAFFDEFQSGKIISRITLRLGTEHSAVQIFGRLALQMLVACPCQREQLLPRQLNVILQRLVACHGL